MYRHVDDDGPADYPLALSGLGRRLDGPGVDAASVPGTATSWLDSLVNSAMTSPFGVGIQSSDAWRNAPNANRNMMPPSASLATTQASKPVLTDVALDPEVKRLYGRVNDLVSFGGISASKRIEIWNVIQSGKLSEADAIISENEARTSSRLSRAPKTNVLAVIDARLPPGYKVREQLIPNVPNGALYAAAALGGVLLLRSMTRKR